MDPDFYRNSLSGRYAGQDITSLISEQAAGLSQVSGLGLGTAFPTHSSLTTAAARSFGPLPGYTGHALHATSQDTHLQNIATQGAYKSLAGQPAFSDPYAGLRLTSQPSPNVTSKPMFTQEQGLLKDTLFATTTSQNASLAWGLSNFVQTQNPNPYVHPAELSVSDYPSPHTLTSQPLLNPPPAHSSKTTHPVQRNPYSGSEMFPTRSTKSPPVQNVYDPRSQTPVSLAGNILAYSQSNTYPPKSDEVIYSASDTMNYEAVSPATPDHHTQQNETYVSLQDLASISSTQRKLEVSNASVGQKRPPSMISDRQNKSQQKPKQLLHQDIYSAQNGQMSQMKQSPQQSPISVGGSPQMQIGSPQAAMPSSTIVQAPPPVQAPADSTTKPKKSRSRKKKDAINVNELKNETLGQGYSPQPFTNSPDLAQRGNGNDFMTNQQQAYMQTNRSQQQQAYSTANLMDSGHSSSPLMTSPMNSAYEKSQNQSTYANSEPSSNIVHQPNSSVPSQAPPQQSQMLVGFQQPPTTSHSAMSYSVSDALEMSREAVFPNQVMMEYGGSDMANYGMQESFTNQLRMDNSMRRPDMYNEGVYVSNPYGGQFVSPNSVLNMDIGNSPHAVSGQPSTIDEAAFSSLMDESFPRDVSPDKRFKTNGVGAADGDKMPYFPLTVKVEAEQDDDLSHLARPVSEKTDSNPNRNTNNNYKHHLGQPPPQPPPANPKPVVKNASGGSSFMDSFLNFLQGKKPETLSSMSSAIIHNKPQLPKYIPEPPRPRRVDPPPESAKHVRKDISDSKVSDKKDNHLNPKSSERPKLPSNSIITFSDDDDENDDSAVAAAITSLGDDNDKVKFSTNKSGGLTMKINLTKVKKAEEAKNKSRTKKSPKSKKRSKEKVKTFGLKESFKGALSSGEDTKTEKEIIPSRQQSARKAKENKGKYKMDEDSDSDTLKPIRKLGDESDNDAYDSDRDPVWTPVNVDKKTPVYDAIDFDGRKKRSRTKGRSKQAKSRKSSSDMNPFVPNKVAKIGEPAVVELDSGSEDEQLDGIPPITEELQVGDYVMEKKDMKNTETYAIWKIESGRMLHKFELFTENSKILHRAIPTFSSWLPSMRNGFVHIRVNTVFKQGDKEYVEVKEQYRPKPAIDSNLEEKYEEHPLVEPFNIYLQIFLSQALEPGFLGAIREANERFYLDSLDKIDSAVSVQLTEIDAKVRWKDKFKEAVKTRPHIRELDRPNLKQSCQACEFASQPAIKSVHLFGNPYDRFSLQEITDGTTHPPQEFMIGKTAAKLVKPYHNLYHFKYNLYKRCHAKVNILQDGNVGDNAAILDQCLQNRAWVLQIFEDLKKMLEKG